MAIGLSLLSIAFSGIVGVSAALVAILSGSLSLLGFGVDAAIDAIASVVLVWRFSIESRAPHRANRVEAVAEGLVGLVLLALAAYLGYRALDALGTAGHPEPSLIGTLLLIVSLVVLPPLAISKLRVARALESGALRADSVLTAMAAALAAIGLVSLGLSEAFGLWWSDAVGALAIAVVLVREGWSSVTSARAELRLV